LAQGRCFEDSFRISKRFLMVCSAIFVDYRYGYGYR
jgi:hypothetical protein